MNKLTKRRINKNKKTKRHIGGKLSKKKRQEEQERQLRKSQFRKMFVNAFNSLLVALSSGEEQQVAKAIEQLTNGLKSNRTSINTLIPVTNNYIPIDKDTYNASITPIKGFIPLLAIIIYNIDNTDIIKGIINTFIDNTGNINLKSIQGQITALSVAVEMRNQDLSSFLIDKGADINTLNASQITLFNELMKNVSLQLTNVAKPKLDLSIGLPDNNGYTQSVEPDFWKPLFPNGELTILREKIMRSMMVDTLQPFYSNTVDKPWSICQLVSTMIPSYYIPFVNMPYTVGDTLYSDLNEDFANYNIILCTTLIIFGIISDKMEGQDYMPVFKGGKAIQLALSTIPDIDVYRSDDIDVIVMPQEGVNYELDKVKLLSGHIAYLVQWFLQIPPQNLLVSVQAPDPTNPRANQNIFKLSYMKSSKRYDKKQKIQVNDYKQFSDVDFKDLPTEVKSMFERSTNYVFFIKELDTKVLFKCPDIGALLDEKVYYFIKFDKVKKAITNNQPVDPEYSGLTVADCDYILNKFKKAIVALNSGLIKRRFPELSSEEVNKKATEALTRRLEKYLK